MSDTECAHGVPKCAGGDEAAPGERVVYTSRHPVIRSAVMEKRNLTQIEAFQLVADYGIPVPRYALAPDAGAAVAAAREIGYPVVMKVVSPDITHKSDVGGVRVGINSDDQARDAYESIISAVSDKCPGAAIQGLMVAQHIGGGDSRAAGGNLRDIVEVAVGITCDVQFGHVVMFGLGGIFIEVLKDVAFRIVPVTELDAWEMIQEIKGYPLLAGVRGRRPRDLAALVGIILNASRLAEENPDIASVDLNPVIALEDGAWAVDVRVLVRGSE